MQVVHPNETFLRDVDVDNMTRDQLEIRAMRMILDSPGVNRRNLPALPDSFNQIKDVETNAAQRLQRRLVILLAKEPKAVYSTGKKSTRQATKNKNQPLIFKVLKEAKLMKMICQYID